MRFQNTVLPANLLRAANLCKAKKDIRYFLNGVCVTPNKIMSADGHMLFYADYSEFENTLELEDQSSVESEVIIDLKRPPKAGATTAVLNSVDDEFGYITYFNYKQEEIDRDIFFVIDGKFPDAKTVVMPHISDEPIPTEEIAFNPDMVAIVDKIFKTANKSTRMPNIKFKLRGPLQGASFSQSISGCGDMYFVAMPLRTS